MLSETGPAILHYRHSYLKLSRTTTLWEGGRFRVDPLVPTKKKHRGRVGTLVAFTCDEGSSLPCGTVRFRFDDTGKSSNVDHDDLVPIEPMPQWVVDRIGQRPEQAVKYPVGLM